MIRRVALVALVLLPACDRCASCDDDAKNTPSGLGATPRTGPAPSDSSITRHLRRPFIHRWADAGARDASASLE